MPAVAGHRGMEKEGGASGLNARDDGKPCDIRNTPIKKRPVRAVFH
jgi:hypothetical protein